MKKKGKTRAPVESPLAFEPALERSTVVNQEGVDKIRPALAANSNEWNTMMAWPCRMWGYGKPLRFKLWGAHEDFPSYRSTP